MPWSDDASDPISLLVLGPGCTVIDTAAVFSCNAPATACRNASRFSTVNEPVVKPLSFIVAVTEPTPPSSALPAVEVGASVGAVEGTVGAVVAGGPAGLVGRAGGVSVGGSVGTLVGALVLGDAVGAGVGSGVAAGVGAVGAAVGAVVTNEQTCSGSGTVSS